MIIKKLTKKHVISLCKLGRQAFKGEQWLSKRFLLETLQMPGSHYGAFQGNKMIGAILVKRFDYPKMWIFFFAVDKDYQRKGIGTKLLKKVEGKCNKSYPLLFVDIGPKDKAARKFYLKNGFKKRATVKDWFGINLTGIIYSKRVC